MFVRLDMRDLNMFGRGIAIFFCVVILGLIVTEMQINNLTHWQESVRVCRVERDVMGRYAAWLLGNYYDVHVSYQMARLTQQDSYLIVDAGGYRIFIPTKVTLDSSDWLPGLERGIRWCEKQMRAGAEYIWEWSCPLKPVIEQAIFNFAVWLKSL
ncbi:hypothetical protein [Acetonema longum]|uniref:Uncharacterized protein n=1 Tax=Acetonema longum DSM 6540 TaxID=1009370 RepID=F7NKV7_9FIRM|nr:hypothetical protein [Acetonema longum]EGO63300.1 hypothetical protein ALO_13629 [Acetonema longum DSM 6540]